MLTFTILQQKFLETRKKEIWQIVCIELTHSDYVDNFRQKLLQMYRVTHSDADASKNKIEI